MEDRRRTRSQGLSEGAQLIQWDSLQDHEESKEDKQKHIGG